MFNRENQFFPGKFGHPLMKPPVSELGGRTVNPSQRVILQPFDLKNLGNSTWTQVSTINMPQFQPRNFPGAHAFTPQSNIDKLERREKDNLNDRLKQTPHYPRGDGSIETKDQKNKDKNFPRPSNSPYSV